MNAARARLLSNLLADLLDQARAEDRDYAALLVETVSEQLDAHVTQAYHAGHAEGLRAAQEAAQKARSARETEDASARAREALERCMDACLQQLVVTPLSVN